MAELVNSTIAVIGAGPVGLLVALLAARAGLDVVVVEAGSGLDPSPRAVAYFPAVLEELSNAGVLQDILAVGEKNDDGCDWKDVAGNLLGSLSPPPNSVDYAVCLSQPELGKILVEKLLATGNARILFNHQFQRLDQDDQGVTYWMSENKGHESIAGKCRYLVGADGGRSAVRRAIGVQFDGFTWNSIQFVAVNFQYPLSDFGWKAATFIVDPVDWGIVVKRGRGHSWRFATGVSSAEATSSLDLHELTVQIVKERLSRILPGEKNSIEYEAMAPYRVHQRCASSFKVGNVLLAGDAAHLNNPVGGLGLTTGLLDAAHLAKSLIQVLVDGHDSKALENYAQVRRMIFRERTDPITIQNLLRLNSNDDEQVKTREQFFSDLNSHTDFAANIKAGLSDYALTSTSISKFDTSQEVTWFISVTKIDDWSRERFEHEYQTVHAGMTRKGKDHGSPLRRYIQLSNITTTVVLGQRPQWDFVTCLTFPSLFLVHAGFQDPGYRATAGAHVFCRLDQEGCLAKQVARYSKDPPENTTKSVAVQALVFHKRSRELDEYSDTWFQKQALLFSQKVKTDDRLLAYTLWQDITPKDTTYFFQDTQFSGGSWHRFKAVEAFNFDTVDVAILFLDQIGQSTVGSKNELIAVIGEPRTVV